jgi:hypothetical protein
MATIAIVKVLLTKFTKLIDGREGRELADYLWGCLTDGMASVLYENPHILTAFYTAGNSAYDALALAITNHQEVPTEDNELIVKAKMALAIIWLRSYANQVYLIANDSTNCTTREEAVININASGLVAQKLTQTKKVKPAKLILLGKNLGTGIGELKIANDNPFVVRSSVFILVSKPPVTSPPTPDAVVSIVDGQFSVAATYAYQLSLLVLDGKGRVAVFNNLIPAQGYSGYGFSKNGNKLIGDLSDPVLVKG